MNKLVPCLVLACLFVTTGAVPGQVAGAADDEKGTRKAKADSTLAGAGESLARKYKEIDVYAENPSLSQVLFRSQGTTLTFSLKTGQVEPVLHMKVLPKINRITFEQNKNGGWFVLWYYGQRELEINADE